MPRVFTAAVASVAGPSALSAHAERTPRASRTKTAQSPAGVQVYYEDSLGRAGAECAAAVLAGVDSAFAQLNSLFGFAVVPGEAIVVADLSGQQDGTGGAYHDTCESRTYYCDCAFDNPERTLALAVAEASEARQALYGHGWNCGYSNGEGLSRLHAEVIFPGALDDYATFPAWLDAYTREDWISKNATNDTDEESNGCAVGFLFWLASRGHALSTITQTGGANLADLYTALGERGNAFDEFAKVCADKWPAHSPSGVTIDDPWPDAPTGPIPPPPPPPSPDVLVSFSEDVPAGSYVLGKQHQQPVALADQLKTMSVQQLLQFLSALVQAILAALPQKPPAPPAVM